MRCQHSDCARVWEGPRRESCFATQNRTKSFCLFDRHRHAWIRLRAKEDLGKKPRFLGVRYGIPHALVDGVPIGSLSLLEVLTAEGPIATDLWRGPVCQFHREGLERSCLVVVTRIQPVALEILVGAAFMRLLVDLDDREAFTPYVEALERAVMDTRSTHVRELEEAAGLVLAGTLTEESRRVAGVAMESARMFERRPRGKASGRIDRAGVLFGLMSWSDRVRAYFQEEALDLLEKGDRAAFAVQVSRFRTGSWTDPPRARRIASA